MAIGSVSQPVYIDDLGIFKTCDVVAKLTAGSNIIIVPVTGSPGEYKISSTGGGSTVVGSIVPYCGTDTPDGFFPCDGREISRESYADLYAVIGNTFGDPTDPTKFKLPKIDDARYLQGNTMPGTQVAAGLPQHVHTYEKPNPLSLKTSGEWSSSPSDYQFTTTTTGGVSRYVDAAGNDVAIATANSVVPKSVTVRYLICWKKTIAKVDAMMGVPDYSSPTSVVNGTTVNLTEAPADGFIVCHTSNAYKNSRFEGWINTVKVNDAAVHSTGSHWASDASSNVYTWMSANTTIAVVSAGDSIVVSGGTGDHANLSVAFYPAKATPAKISELYMGAPDWANAKTLTNVEYPYGIYHEVTQDGFLCLADIAAMDVYIRPKGTSLDLHVAHSDDVLDAATCCIPVSAGDKWKCSTAFIPNTGAHFIPRKKIQIDASDITATGACGVPNYDAYDSTKHDIAFDTIVTKAASGYGNITNRAGKNCFVATEDCFVFPGCYAVNAGNPDSIGIFVGESNSSTYMFRYSCQDIVGGDQVHYTAVPLKKGQIVTVLCADADSSLSGKCYWLPMQSLAPQIAMPDYSATPTTVTNGWTAPENGWIKCHCIDKGQGGSVISINSTNVVGLGIASTSIESNVSTIIPISKNDIVTWTNTCDCNFYPCKIVQQSVDAPYVVERKRGTNTDGSSWWYTLWSDKWCEQGGKATIDVIDKNIDPSKSISLKKAMEKDTLSIQLTAATTPADHTPCSMYGVAQSSTAIWVTFDHVGGDEIVVPRTVPFFWRAEGYVA